MSELRAVQLRFLNYLRHADASIDADVSGMDASASARRLSIYYNAYRMRLRESIDTDHPVLGLYLGDELFDRMVREYIDAYPSVHTSLRHFCDRLPAFLRDHAPFADSPVLADLAAFERALMDVFDAADAPRLDADYLAALSADQWPGLTLEFHPSMRCFVTGWNSVEIWRAIKAERAPPDACEGPKKAWLMWRNRERLTEFRSLTVDEYTVLSSAQRGANLAELCETLLEWHLESAVADRAYALLKQWLAQGVVTR